MIPPPNQCAVGVSAPTYTASATSAAEQHDRGGAGPTALTRAVVTARRKTETGAEEHREDHRGTEIGALEEEPPGRDSRDDADDAHRTWSPGPVRGERAADQTECHEQHVEDAARRAAIDGHPNERDGREDRGQ